MKLKRVAAFGATALGLLAVPATAMASAGGPPPRPVAVKVVCPPFRPPPRPVPIATLTPVRPAPAKVVPVKAPAVFRVFACCGKGVVEHVSGTSLRAVCAPQSVLFDMPAGGRTLTELRGPRLRVHELIVYRRGIYSVASVRGANFTLDLRGKPFVNRGPAIRDGRALILRNAVVVEFWVPRPPK